MMPSGIGTPGTEWVITPCPDCGAAVWSWHDQQNRANQRRACVKPCRFAPGDTTAYLNMMAQAGREVKGQPCSCGNPKDTRRSHSESFCVNRGEFREASVE